MRHFFLLPLLLLYSQNLRRLRWNREGSRIATLNQSSISVLDVESSSSFQVRRSSEGGDKCSRGERLQNESRLGQDKVLSGNALVWEPHFDHQVAVCTGHNTIQSWDTRANSFVFPLSRGLG